MLSRIRKAIWEKRVKGLDPKFVVLTDGQYEELLSELDERGLTAFTDARYIKEIYGCKIIMTYEKVDLL